MTNGIKGLVCALGMLLPATASAWNYTGNPTVSIWVDRSAHDIQSASVNVAEVRVHKCAGGYATYAVDQTLDLTTTLTLTIQGGDLCGVSVDYGSTMRVEQTGQGWIVDHEEVSSSIELQEVGPSSAALTPLQMVEGPVSGQYPRIYVDIN